MHLVRYRECLAPHSNLRTAIVPTPRQQGLEAHEGHSPSPHWAWAIVPKRLFSIDIIILSGVQLIMIFLRLLVLGIGLSLVLITLLSTIRVFVLPRAAPDRLAAFVFLTIRRLYQLRLRWARTYTERDRVISPICQPCTVCSLGANWPFPN